MGRVLVTGANGFVCSNLIHVLLEQGCAVVAADQSFEPALLALWSGRPVQYLVGDVEALPDVPVDYVIHGAAVTASPDDRLETPEANFKSNLNPAIAMLEWCARNKVSRAIFISSSAVFREHLTSDLTESIPAYPVGLYSVAKKAIEELVHTFRVNYQHDLISVRLGNVYGPWEHRRSTRPRLSLVGRLVEEAITRHEITVPETTYPADWTFVRDIGRALVALLFAPALNNDLYHVSTGCSYSGLDLAGAVKAQIPSCGIKFEGEPTPFRGVLRSERLEADTGFSMWTDLEDGLQETITWFRQVLERTP
jgi:UDP-glucose 4-epimerase